MAIILLAFFILLCGAGYWLINHDRGPREPVKGIALAFSMGLIGFLIAAVVEYLVTPGSDPDVISLPVAAMIGVIEELCKFAPLALLLFRKPYFNEVTDGLIYFGICGLAFGWLENVSYTLSYGSGTGIERLVIVPFFHAATAGLVGYALARYRLGIATREAVLGSLVLMMVAHGGYDFLISSGVGQFVLAGILITVALNIAFLNAYQRARQIDSGLGLRRESADLLPVPIELGHWNWGAFLLTWIWAIAHDSWVGLLTLVLPIFAVYLAQIHSPFTIELGRYLLITSIAVAIYLGWKGNSFAWRNRHFESVEQFRATERRWSRWGTWVTVSSIPLVALVILLAK